MADGIRVIICGGRNFRDRALFVDTMDQIDKERGIGVVIHGCAWGADHEAEVWGVVRKKQMMRFPADWEKYGPSAGPRRNKQMLNEGKPHLIVAFPGGKGTADMVSQARRACLEVIEIDTP